MTIHQHGHWWFWWQLLHARQLFTHISTPLQQALQLCPVSGLSFERISPTTESSCVSHAWDTIPVAGESGMEEEETWGVSHKGSETSLRSPALGDNRWKIRWQRARDPDYVLLASICSSIDIVVEDKKDFSSKSVTEGREKLSSNTVVAKHFAGTERKASITTSPSSLFSPLQKNFQI